MHPFDPATFFAQIHGLPTEVRRATLAGIATPEDAEHQIQSAIDQKLPLAGQACLVKDNFDVLGFPTRASSLFLEKVRPTPAAEGPMLQTLRRKGLAILGKTQMNEFAYGLDGANPHYGNCPHPKFPDRMPGGSSSGSAWAAGRNLVPIAFGTDTGGSIRLPSAFCGLFGLRLSPDSWALQGCFPLAPSFDAAGWMTSSAQSLSYFTRELLDLPNVPPTDALTIKAAHPMPDPFTKTAENLFGQSLSGSFPLDDFAKPEAAQAFNVLQSREAYEIHRDWLGPHQNEYDPAVIQRIKRAEQWRDEDVVNAQAIRTQYSERFEAFFEDADVALLPVSLRPATSYPMVSADREEILRFTAPASLAALPALSVPVELPDGEVAGLQCILPLDRWKPVLVKLLQLLIQ